MSDSSVRPGVGTRRWYRRRPPAETFHPPLSDPAPWPKVSSYVLGGGFIALGLLGLVVDFGLVNLPAASPTPYPRFRSVPGAGRLLALTLILAGGYLVVSKLRAGR